jgi:hypothetical protein
MANYEEGLEAKTKKLTASFEALSMAVLDSNTYGGALEGASGLLDIITNLVQKLGTIPTLLAAITTGLSLAGKNAGKEYALLRLIA